MDALVWIVGGALIVALFVWLVIWIIKRSNAKYAQLWGGLTGEVNGSFKGSKMTGTYQGMPLAARINAVSDGDNSSDYFWVLTLTPGAGGKDWSLSYTGEKMLGLGAKSWQVKTKDEALKERLIAAGAPEIMAAWPSHPSITYKAKHGTLTYENKVGGAFSIPGPDEFKSQLNLLSQLSQVNQQANLPQGAPVTA